MFFETLENRTLFSVSLSSGILTVTGTNANDVISVTKNAAGQVAVNDNGSLHNYGWNSVKQVVVSSLAGNDNVFSQDSMTKPMHLFGGSGNETLRGGGGNDVINGGSGPGKNWLFGGKGDDVIYGNGNQNYIEGDAGNDYLNCYASGFTWEYGGDGNDSLFGGMGGSDLHGGNGDDILMSNYTTQETWMSGDAGNDSITGGAGVSELHGGTGDDVIRGGGTTSWIYGDAGNDRLYGGYGPSWVYGGDGNDSLFGGSSNDYLSGDAGDDVIVSIGGGTADVLHGGDGFDSFWCDNASAEKIDDESFVEAIFGAGHVVGTFANGASTQLWGQNLTDPTDSGAMHNYAKDPLFSSSGPTQNDIAQGGVGDCYFLAALSATAKTDAIRIRQSVVDLGDGTYAVQFWKYGVPQFVRVDADLPTDAYGNLVYAKLGHGNSLWVPIMEKAFAYFRHGQNTYASTSTGWSSEVFYDLNAPVVTAQYWAWTSGSQLLNYIQSELTAGKAVTVGTPQTVTSGCPCVGSHMYMVDHVNYVQRRFGLSMAVINVPVSVTLRNPWGYDGAYDGSDPTDGYVTVTASQAIGSFDTVQSAVV